MTRLSEDGLIAHYFAPLAGPGGLGLADDAALLTPEPGQDLVLTVDGLVAGVHFFPNDPPASIARKALGVNLSDLASKGAAPLGYLLTLALPDDWTEDWLGAFSVGLGEAARAAGCTLLGGDTVRAAGPLSLSITAVGGVPAGTMVRRTTGKPGDHLCVSGTIGDAVLGLALRLEPEGACAAALPPEDRAFLLDRYLHPQARLALAPALRRYARAAMDVSDGLIGDATKMMRASGVTAAIDLAAVPFSEAARRAMGLDAGWRNRLVTGGDDYEILACIPDRNLSAFLGEAARVQVAVTVIGQVQSGKAPPQFSDDTGVVSFARGSFSHF